MQGFSTIIIYIIVVAIIVAVNAAKAGRKRASGGSSSAGARTPGFRPSPVQRPADANRSGPERHGYTTHASPPRPAAGAEKADWSDDARSAYSAMRVPEWERPRSSGWFSFREKSGEDPWDRTPERDRNS